MTDRLATFAPKDRPARTVIRPAPEDDKKTTADKPPKRSAKKAPNPKET